jgi:hypothetical protein
MTDEPDAFTLALVMEHLRFFLPRSLPPVGFVRHPLFSEVFLV